MRFFKTLFRINPLASSLMFAPVKPLLSLGILLIFSLTSNAEASQICRRVFITESARLSENYQLFYSNPNEAERIQHNFDLMGMMGVLYDLKIETNTSKVVAFPNKLEMASQRRSMKARLSRLNKTPSAEFREKIEKYFAVKILSSGLVMIRFSPDETFNMDLMTERGYMLLIKRFFKTYENLVSFSYRLAGLESNSTSSNVQMMVETKILQQVDKRNMTYQMIFDPQVWNKLMVLMEKEVSTAQATSWDSKANKSATEKLIHIMEPLYPVAGVALSIDRKNPSAPIEIKRYFKNEYEDPLGLVNLTEKNDFRDRHEMLYETFKDLPPGQKLEIHAHSLVHARAYMKLGFERVSIIENPLYPGVQVHELHGTREQVLEKIAGILGLTPHSAE